MNLFLKRRTIIHLIILLLLTSIILYLLIKEFKFSNLKLVLSSANIFLIILMLLISFGGPLFSAIRWHYLLSSVGYEISLTKSLNITLASMAFLFIPGRLGDLAKLYPLKNKLSTIKSLGSVVAEKVIDLISLLFISSLSLLIIRNYLYASLLSGFLIIIIAVLYLIKSKGKILIDLITIIKIKKIFKGLYSVSDLLSENKKNLILAFMSSLGNWVVSLITVYIIFKALGANPPILAIFAFMPLAILIGLIPITLAGMGTRDSVIIYFFAPYATSAQSLGVGLIYSFSGYWLYIIIGLIFIHYLMPKTEIFFKKNHPIS